MRRSLSLVVATLLVLGLQTGTAGAVDVHGDDAGDRFIGTGSVILGVGTEETIRRQAADCADCRWLVQSLCTDVGLGFGATSGCGSDVLWCPDGQRLRHIYLAVGDAAFDDRGFACVGGAGPVSVDQVSSEVRDAVAAKVPGVMLTQRPRTGALTQLPVLFAGGQRVSSVTFEHVISGQQVSVVATAVRHWDFGDGHGETPHSRGCPYRECDAWHVYQRPGSRWVTLRVVWRAIYTVDGLGPFEVPEPVEQVAQRAVLIGEGRAVLTSGRPSGGLARLGTSAMAH